MRKHPYAPERSAKTVPKVHLTDVSVQRLKPGLFFDTKTPAFGIRVGANLKTWLVIRGENRTKVRLGHYPAMSLAEARKRALVSLGSPMQEKPSISFPDAIDAFLALPRWRPQSRRVLTCSLRHFSWKRNVDKISHEDVASAIEAIGGSSARAHALKDIRTFFNWCVPRYLTASPCAGLKMDAQPSRERVLTHDELKTVWNACEGTFGTIVKLLILTGQRKMEVGSLQWGYIGDSTVTLPADITKNGREHTFPLGSLARSLLPPKGNSYLFRSAGRSDLYNGYAYHLKQLQKASGTSGWTLHDLRRTFATNLAALGVAIHVTERLLNHASGTVSGVAAIYNRHTYLPEMTAAIHHYEQHIKELVK